MKTKDFDYHLPEYLIAQTPIKKRNQSRLMIVNKKTGSIEHKKFNDIIDYLNKDDVLVLNDSKVIPARLIGVKKDTGAMIEILLLRKISNKVWECLVKPAKKIKEGTIIIFDKKLLQAQCIEKKEDGICLLKLNYDGNLYKILDKLGEMPLPPYIHRQLNNKDRYQTIYAKKIGSIAAPTAGFHFTNDLLTKIKKKGIKIVYITLHVGIGTFRPVTVDNIAEHKMHEEFYIMNDKTAKILNNAKESGNKIISVGTTTTRTLETIINKYGEFKKDSGWTNIFIYPLYQFKAVDVLITNFHLPKSTLIMLVSAFAGKDLIMKVYKEAIKKEYRFFSFGDCMLIK